MVRDSIVQHMFFDKCKGINSLNTAIFSSFSITLILISFVVSAFSQAGGYLLLFSLFLVQLSLCGGRVYLHRLTKAITVLVSGFLFLWLLSGGGFGYYQIVDAIKLLCWVVIGLCVTTLSDKDIKILLVAIRVLVIATIFFYPFQVDRLFGYFEHPNHLAYVSVVLVAYSLFFDNSKYKFIYALVLMIVVALTKSSGGILSVALIAVVYGMVRARGSIKYLLSYVLLLIVLSFVIFYFDLHELIIDKINGAVNADINRMSSEMTFGSSGSLAWRFSYWQAIFDEFISESSRSKLVGLGPATLTYGNYAYSFMYTDPHNDYLRVLVERGWLGLTLFVFFIFYLIRDRDYRLVTIMCFMLPMLSGNLIVNLPYIIVFIVVLVGCKKYSGSRCE